MSLNKLGKNLGGIISKNSPTILTVCAVGGLVTTAILAVRATPKALEILEDEYNERWIKLEHVKQSRKITKLDIVKLTWKCYIPATAVGAASVACIIGANAAHLRRNAALASVYGITEAAFKEYQAKVSETLGKNKERKLRDDISADRIQKNPSSSNEIILTAKGDVLCYDTLSGRYFKSDIEQIRRVINQLNREMLSEMFISLNEVYYSLGLPSINLGNEIGWHVDRGLIEVYFSTQLSTDGNPCIVLNYQVDPKYI